ncbi:ankyrin repeat-containing protein [Tanacetum coccineum]
MTNKKFVELDAEFIEYKAEAKASMNALEKKIDDGIRKLDVSIKAMKEVSDVKLDAKIEELKQLILGTAPSQSTHVDLVPQITKVVAKTAPTTIGKNLRPKSWDVEGSNKHDPGTTNDMNGERFKPYTESLFVEGMQPTASNEKVEDAGVECEDAYGWIYKVERYFEIQGLPQHEQLRAAALCMEGEALSWYRWSEGRTPFHLWDGFKRCLLIRFQQSHEGNLYEQFLAITQEESAQAYVALFEKLACQLVGILESVMESTFIKGLKHALWAAVRVMNPEGLNNAMELAVSIKDNQLYEGVMQSKGVVAIVGQTTSKGVMLVDESDEAEEPDLNFKSWDRGSKID